MDPDSDSEYDSDESKAFAAEGDAMMKSLRAQMKKEIEAMSPTRKSRVLSPLREWALKSI